LRNGEILDVTNRLVKAEQRYAVAKFERILEYISREADRLESFDTTRSSSGNRFVEDEKMFALGNSVGYDNLPADVKRLYDESAERKRQFGDREVSSVLTTAALGNELYIVLFQPLKWSNRQRNGTLMEALYEHSAYLGGASSEVNGNVIVYGTVKPEKCVFRFDHDKRRFALLGLDKIKQDLESTQPDGFEKFGIRYSVLQLDGGLLLPPEFNALIRGAEINTYSQDETINFWYQKIKEVDGKAVPRRVLGTKLTAAIKDCIVYSIPSYFRYSGRLLAGPVENFVGDYTIDNTKSGYRLRRRTDETGIQKEIEKNILGLEGSGKQEILTSEAADILLTTKGNINNYISSGDLERSEIIVGKEKTVSVASLKTFIKTHQRKGGSWWKVDNESKQCTEQPPINPDTGGMNLKFGPDGFFIEKDEE